MHFSEASIQDVDGAGGDALDVLPFGVIGLGPSGDVEVYSAAEARMAGLSRESVVGRHFFTAVAPCMNNFMVAQRLEDEPVLDAVIDYVLTFRMRPTPVKLRLLKDPAVARRYLLIQR
jgi:photoactive yellow protein